MVDVTELMVMEVLAVAVLRGTLVMVARGAITTLFLAQRQQAVVAVAVAVPLIVLRVR